MHLNQQKQSMSSHIGTRRMIMFQNKNSRILLRLALEFSILDLDLVARARFRPGHGGKAVKDCPAAKPRGF